MWTIATALVRNVGGLENLLEEGYEPFAVTTDSYGDRIWLKRKVEEKVIETDNQPDKPEQGASRRTAKKPKG